MHFDVERRNTRKLILKSPRFVQFCANVSQFSANLDTPDYYSKEHRSLNWGQLSRGDVTFGPQVEI